MKILALCGSLRAVSSNRAALEAARLLAPPGTEITIWDIGRLPYFNPDLDQDPLPDSVAELRRLVGACDRLLISSPEYARGIAGSLKNALDWLVSSLEFPEKQVVPINTSQRATEAQAQLRLVLATMSADLRDTITLPLLGAGLDAAALGIIGAEIEPADAGKGDGRRAHRAGLQGDIEIAADQARLAESLSGGADGQDFGMGRGIVELFHAVAGPGDDLTVLDQNGADRHLAARAGGLGFLKCDLQKRRHSV